MKRLLPQSPLQWVAAVLALLFLAGAAGFFLGARADHPDRSSVSVGFLYDMITHHEQAIQMSNVELSLGETSEVAPFAREILLFQSYEIGLMEQKLDEWGYERSDRPATAMGWMPGNAVPPEAMAGMASEDELDALADGSGREVDALFVPLMQDHHRGGLHMAAYAAENAEDRWVRELAARMFQNQRTEVAELERARERANLSKEPAPYVAAVIPGDTHEH